MIIGSNVQTKLSSEEKLPEETQAILDTYQGPYKDENSSWEGVIELRKLLFNTYYLINENIYRLTLCTFTSICILVHHKTVNPLKNENSNRAETLSLSLLCTVFPDSGIVTKFSHERLIISLQLRLMNPNYN